MKPLVPYYEKLGFVTKGPSEAQFGGGGWFDMVSSPPPPFAASYANNDRYSTSSQSRREPCTDEFSGHRRQAPHYMDEFSRHRVKAGKAPHCMHLLEKLHHSAHSAIPLS